MHPDPYGWSKMQYIVEPASTKTVNVHNEKDRCGDDMTTIMGQSDTMYETGRSGGASDVKQKTDKTVETTRSGSARAREERPCGKEGVVDCQLAVRRRMV